MRLRIDNERTETAAEDDCSFCRLTAQLFDGGLVVRHVRPRREVTRYLRSRDWRSSFRLSRGGHYVWTQSFVS